MTAYVGRSADAVRESVTYTRPLLDREEGPLVVLTFTRSRGDTKRTRRAGDCSHACMLGCFGRVPFSAPPWTVAHQVLCPWNSPGKNTGVGCHALLQGNLPILGIEPASPALAGRSFTTRPTWKSRLLPD